MRTFRKGQRRVVVFLSVVMAVMLSVPAAMAWSDTYAENQIWYGGEYDQSGYNYSLNGQAGYWTTPFGGDPLMGSRYVNDAGGNSFMWYSGGGFVDFRDISYGAARCKAYDGNIDQIWTDYCYTNN
jgi:hypothetical protein